MDFFSQRVTSCFSLEVAPIKKWHQYAFTFIELLIVLLILSIVSAFIMLKISSGNDERALRERSQYMAELLRFAREEALFLPATLGVLITDHGLGFYQYELKDPFDLDSAIWKRLELMNLSQQTWQTSMHVRLTVSHQEQNLKTTVSTVTPLVLKPQIIFSVTGQQTPFTLSFSVEDTKKQFNIIGQSNGEIRWEEQDLP